MQDSAHKKLLSFFSFKIILLFIFSFSFIDAIQAQTIIWSEDFSGDNGNSSESGRWSTSGYVGANWFRVENQKLEIRDNNRQVAEWLTSSINIAGYSNVSVSINAQEAGGLEPKDNIDEDYILFQYRIDGGSWQDFSSSPWYDDFSSNNTDRNASITGLSGSTLQVRVQFKNGTGNYEYYRIDDVEVTGESVTYCIPTGRYTNSYSYAYISNVNIGDIDNNSNSSGFMDYTNLSTDLNPAQNYTLTVTPSYYNNGYECELWVDWNNDGNFDGANETISTSAGSGKYTATITPPSGVIGEITMRVRIDWFGGGNACADIYYGEVEDYTLNVIASGATPVAKCKDHTVYLDASGNAIITPVNINNGSSDVETVNANLLLSLDKNSFDCSNLGANTVTLTVEDEAGNKSTCSSTVTVVDDLNPTAQCKNITVQLNASGNASITGADVDNGSTDNCAISSMSVNKSNFSNADVGTNTVILTVSDASGNLSTCNAVVTVLAFIPEVSLSVSPSSIDENGGNAFLTATLTGIASTDVLVNLAMSGTASTSDYAISKLQIVVPQGSLSASITVSAVNDTDIEGDESLNVSVSSVVGGTENGTQMVMVTIVDDDFPSEDSIEVNRQSPEDKYDSEGLVRNVLVTGCLTADNISYSGDEKDGVGYFNAGTSDFPLSSGVIISTGKVRDAEGRNDKTNESSNIDGATADSDVTRLNTNARDVQILEFDFVPAGDKLEFRYLFASEEYPEYACGAYNDVFGFILSGPGISGPFLNGGENIALLPSSTNFVTINNVNDQGCGNASFYVDGTGGFATQFDGRTIVLTASADVVPCQTYHIRLIIADVSDRTYDSAVFLEAESFKSNEVEIQNGIGVEDDVDFMYEGCGGSYIKFVRKEDFEDEMTFDLNISGSAENGVDYLYVDAAGNQIGDGKIPTTVTLPAGMDELVYYYKALSDDDIEGDEELRLSFLKNCPCSAPDYYEKVVTIIDVPEIEASPTSLVSCLGATPVATITVDLKFGLDPADYQYSLDGGAFQDNNVFTLSDPTVGATHTISVQDRFACRSASFDIVMPAVTPIAAEAGPAKTICEGETVQLEGGGGIYYEWSCSPNAGLGYLNNVNAPNPTVAADIPYGSYTYTLTVKESSSASASCIDTDNMVLTVNENSHFTISTDKLEYCSGEVINLKSTIQNSNGDDSYLWTPAADVANSISANTSVIYSTSVLVAKDFSLTVTKSNGCSNTENISGIFINPHPVVSLNSSSNVCSDGSNGTLNVDVSTGTPFGSSPFYNYSWSHDGGLNSPDATGLGVGGYTVTVTDAKSCSKAETFSVVAEPSPKGIYHE
ncbi:choice-of-anchor L domain-containing protein [Labilibaculum sp. DW002]|uniref:Choice-of-anchor L domain-containing protein n=1 Tax=Paralabilibaculum antarcticum TaxID=2912572 RepID=A0ABT5VYQ9_9BACT|nr:choice-of-anchor L domain-containing protein [Labilibaculum sp. DW002]MDE5420544.1 choice-of-anchor L domain-containing protein [Labilibaculum sp. DW002]